MPRKQIFKLDFCPSIIPDVVDSVMSNDHPETTQVSLPRLLKSNIVVIEK